jgi:ribosomal protein S7
MVKFKILKFASFKKNFFKKIVGAFTKNGKKLQIKKQLNLAFQFLQQKTGYSFAYLLNTLFIELNTFVEVRQIFIRKKMFFVPFFISVERRLFLAIKWFIQSLKQSNEKGPFFQKFIQEFLLLLKFESVKEANSVGLKKNNDLLAIKNRANIHYRW